MKESRLAALVFLFLAAAACFLAAGTALAQPSLSLAPDAQLEIVGAGLQLVLDGSGLLERPLETFTCWHVSSSGEVFETEVTGFSLGGLLAENGLALEHLASLNFIASDGYVMAVPAEIWAGHGVYIMLARDGEGLEYPRSCIPEQRSMYWVKNLTKIELVPAEEFASQLQVPVKRLTFFREAVQQLEPEVLNNRGQMVSAYGMEAYFAAFARALPQAPVMMRARDGLEKLEKPEIFLGSYVTLESEPGRAEDVPLYFAEDLSLGMRVKQLDVVIAGEDAIYFGSEAPLAELFAQVGMVEAASYTFRASDGFEVQIPAEAIPYGVLYPDEKAGYLRIKFEGYDLSGVQGGGKVKYVIAVEAGE